MTLLAHLSDLQFGAEDPAIASALLDELRAAPPALIAISGDLTRRARDAQFATARAYLAHLPSPYLAVPGNHDIPLYDVVSRFLHPLRGYRRYITAEPTPTFADSEICVVGLETVHAATFKGGKVRLEQLTEACDVFAVNAHRWKVLVAHHPFVIPDGVPDSDLVEGAGAALDQLVAARVDLILTGHRHMPHPADSAGFRDRAHRVIAVHAGTCFSTRTRAAPNGYNRLEFDGDVVSITHRVWERERFVDGTTKRYRRGGVADRLVKVGEWLGASASSRARSSSIP